ncbi:MAG: N-acetylneuraminate synthase family protein, partial [Planctomycetota bacterium]
MLRLNNKSVLKWVIDRLSDSSQLDEVIVATSSSASDDKIEDCCQQWQVPCFRGSENDVLGRFVGAAKKHEADVVVRINADNPLIDSDYIDGLVKCITAGRSDYVSYQTSAGKPVMLTALGFFAEALSRSCLEKAGEFIEDPFEREHVTLGIYKRPDVFKVRFLPIPEFCDHPDIRLTLDTQGDFGVLQKIVAALGPKADSCKSRDVIELLQHRPDLLNMMSEQNACNPKKQDNKRNWKMSCSDKTIYSKNLDMETLPSIKVAKNRWVGDDQPCFIIAEVGQNHNGNMSIAKELIDNIAFHKADAVKLCKRDIPSELTREAYNKPYYGPQSFGQTYGTHREYLELSKEQYKELKTHSEEKGVFFFATACDMKSVDDLEEVGVTLYKVASRDLTNIPLLDYMARTSKPVILSCGMNSLEEIGEAIDAIRSYHNDIILLQCTSSYPTPYEDVNIRAMQTLRKEFGVLTGMSDHTVGVMVPVVAAALGAVVVEKHVT